MEQDLYSVRTTEVSHTRVAAISVFDGIMLWTKEQYKCTSHVFDSLLNGSRTEVQT
jgi:hypothetical protein